MEDNIKILIIPDVHARDFWREPVEYVLNNTDAKIIFLGDYLDPYPEEFEKGIDYREKAINGFKDIINIKKENNTRVSLLLGNHDCGYRFDFSCCNCRTDYRNVATIKSLFYENRNLFLLADEAYIKDKHFIFSHAGIHKGYVDFAFPDEKDKINENNIVANFNNAYLTENERLIDTLGMFDIYRSFGGYDYGSIVWADVNSWFGKEYDGYGYEIFGHTQLIHGCGGIIRDNFADLDSAEAFIINDLGELKKFSLKKD